MTKAIEDELGLPRLADALREASGEPEEAQDSSEVDDMARALEIARGRPPVADPMGTADHENESDEIYEMALQAHKDLLDLGFNIEPKHAGANAFAPSAKFLEIALKASQSKASARMDRIKAIMEREKHDREMGQDVQDGEIVEQGNSILANRNDIMDKIRKGEI